MKTEKKIDSVKMMREIRDKINSEIINMSPDQILEYLKKTPSGYTKVLKSNNINKKQ